MSIASQILRPDRLARFREVWRTEGPKRACSAALRHSRRIAARQPQSAVQSAIASDQVSDKLTSHKLAFTPLWRDLARADAFHIAATPATLRKRRAIAMIGDLNLPQCRKYRIEQLDEIFGLLDADYRFSHYEDIPRCLDILQDATHLMLYRLPMGELESMYSYEARRLKLPILYDIDDPLFSVSAYEQYSNAALFPAALKTAFIDQAPGYLSVLNEADAVTVSTPGLAELTKKYTNRPVWMRRNFADEATLAAGKSAIDRNDNGHRDFRVAFASGSVGHEADFAIIAEDLSAFLAGADNRKLMILGNFDESAIPEDVRAKVTRRPFTSYENYMVWLARADCAVMPLTDDPFNRTKSAVRVLDAAAAGVPALVSNVGDLCAPVLHGETGFVLGPGDCWLGSLEDLASDRKGCRRFGKMARENVSSSWRANTNLPVSEPEFTYWIKA